MIEDLAAVRDKALNWDETAIELATLYETKFGIFNHADPVLRKQHPFALVSVHPKEDTTTYSPLYRRFAQYRLLKIKDLFGLSLTEFLECPRDYVEEMIRQAEQDIRSNNHAADKVEREMAQATRGAK